MTIDDIYAKIAHNISNTIENDWAVASIDCELSEGAGRFGFRALLQRGRLSADLADALWGTPLQKLICEKKMAVIGDFDAGGAVRACPATAYYEALRLDAIRPRGHHETTPIGIPLCRMSGQKKMSTANERPLWECTAHSPRQCNAGAQEFPFTS